MAKTAASFRVENMTPEQLRRWIKPIDTRRELAADREYRLARQKDREKAAEICRFAHAMGHFDLLSAEVFACETVDQAKQMLNELSWSEHLIAAQKNRSCR